jgi:hypothetical protein
MVEQVKHYYWSAKHGCIVTSETPPEVMTHRTNWGQYMLCNYLSTNPKDHGLLGRGSKGGYTVTHAHGRDLHPINGMEILAIQSHPEPWTVMPKAY